MRHQVGIISMALLAAVGLTTAPSFAQTQGSLPAQTPTATQTTQDFSQAQLQKFAQAQAAVSNIRSSVMQDMRQVESREEAKRISTQARKDMRQAVQDAGLSIKQYNRIGRAMQANPKLAQTIQQLQQ